METLHKRRSNNHLLVCSKQQSIDIREVQSGLLKANSDTEVKILKHCCAPFKAFNLSRPGQNP